MDFVFLSEADTHPGETHYHRFHDLVQEVLLAEKVGFDAFGTSEQHVAIGTASMSAPECFYPYMMPLTNRTRSPWNTPTPRRTSRYAAQPPTCCS